MSDFSPRGRLFSTKREQIGIKASVSCPVNNVIENSPITHVEELRILKIITTHEKRIIQISGFADPYILKIERTSKKPRHFAKYSLLCRK